MMRGSKLNVVWLCHFINSEMQSKLPLFLKKEEFASWIPNLIKGFESREDINLNVIVPLEYLKRKIRLTIRGVHYIFIPLGIPVIHRHWPALFRFDLFTKYYFIRKKIRYEVKRIDPDIINLLGTENTFYSSSILDFQDEYPVLITLQGFAGEVVNPQRKVSILFRVTMEEKILKSFKYFTGEKDSSFYISRYNSNYVFFKMYFPVDETLGRESISKEKKYDCIYFGRLTREKGVEDFIRVVSEIKKKRPDTKACIVGWGNISPYVKLAKELSCEKNIHFAGFVDSQKELFEIVKASRIFLVPPHVERLSSTIREAMFLKVPVVAYSTGGIPYINEERENIYLVTTGDFLEMAEKTLILLDNDELRNELGLKAYEFWQKEFSLKVNIERLLSAYEFVINDFTNGKNLHLSGGTK
jgi:glycosyltransferase involved in cell wall biosynthesis